MSTNPHATRATLRLFWRTSSAYPARMALALGVPVVTVLLTGFAGPFIISLLLGHVQDGTLTWDVGWPLVGWYAAVQVVGSVIGWRIALWASWTLGIRGMQALYERVFAHLTSHSVAFHADRFSGTLVSATNKLTGAFEEFWDTIVWMVIPITVTIVATVVVMAFVLWPYAIVLAVLSAAFLGLVWATARTMEPLNVAEAQSSNTMTGFLADVMTNIGAVKSHGSEDRELHGAGVVADRWQERSMGVMRPYLGYSAGYAGIAAVLNTAAVLAAVAASQTQALPIPAIYLAVTYTMTVTQQLWDTTQVMRQFNRILGDAHDMVTILDTPADVPDHTGTEFRPGRGRIEVRAIRFGHDGDHDSPLFDGFSLSVAPGERIGLVGASGSGKSTLIRLLLRFSDVNAGSIEIDGQDVRSVTQESLRRAMAYVPQEPLLFHRSLRDNIAYGRPEATDAEVRDAAAKAFALDFIESLPDGFDTMVGERGVKLSGGQRQRIAIARTVLKDAPILLLDEATSALDSESEVHIQAALTEAMRGRTTVVIAHRLSTVQQMDRILVMADGRIVEDGSHDELRRAGGSYAQLWAHQSGGFLHQG